MRFRKILAIAGFAIFSGSLIFLRPLMSESNTTDDLGAQEKIYVKYCQRCHAADGSGTVNGKPLAIAKQLKLSSPDLLSIVGKSSIEKSEAELRRLIAEGKDEMPGYNVKFEKLPKRDFSVAKMVDMMLAYTRHLQKVQK